jgi:nicotinate dehydrogenase subunit A
LDLPETFSFTVNGSKQQVSVKRDTTLLTVLRNDLNLKGARFGCGDGLCGACIVIVEDRAIFSCDTPVWAVEGKDVETIEGLAKDGALHPLQQAFLEEQAGQCGYCLTGIIMRAKALFGENPNASRQDIATALDRNLCRCGTHNRILNALEKAGAEMAQGDRS